MSLLAKVLINYDRVAALVQLVAFKNNFRSVRNIFPDRFLFEIATCSLISTKEFRSLACSVVNAPISH